jgi:hypothetical protein
MTPRLVLYISAGHDFYHTSRFLTGLCSLEALGEISLRYVQPRGDHHWLAGDPIVLCFDLEPPGVRVAVDLRDGPGFSRPILDRVDLYLKRAFDRPELSELPSSQAERVQPFGLNYGCRSTRSTVRLLGAIGWSLAQQGRAALPRLRQYLSRPGQRAFEQDPDVAVEPKVMFQTRLWTKDEIPPEEVEPLNQARVAMVRTLRRAFGERFIGGLMPTPFALASYPAEISRHSSRHTDYLALKKRCLVSIYTRGVEHSLAFKLGETIAASQCLVSVPLRYELPVPLVEGRNYLPFETPEEAVRACQRLFDDAELASAMRHANHSYYAREVEPAAHARNVIRRALASCGPDAPALVDGSAPQPRQ